VTTGRADENGVSGTLGSVFLIIIVVAGMAVLMVAVISQPHPQNVPAMTAEVIQTSDSLTLRHDGGDTLNRGEFKILVDGLDKTSAFGDPATWSIGQPLVYSVNAGYDPQNPPGTIQIVYTGGSGGQVIEQVWVKPPTLVTLTNPETATPSPTASGTSTTSTTTITSIPTGTATSTGTTPQPTASITTTTATPTPVPLPVANFAGTPLSGSAPLTVQFSDTSTGNPTSWSWSFDDGGTSTAQNPSHTYSAAGSYTVTLTATNYGGSNSITKTGYISVTPGPTPASSVSLSANKPGYLVSGGYIQFTVTEMYSKITHGSTDHNLNVGDIVRLTINSDTQGSSSGGIYATVSQISTFAFNDVDLIVNGNDYGRKPITYIYISGYGTYSSTLTLKVPSQSAWTSFTADGNSVINGNTDSRPITVYNLGMESGGMNFKSSNIYYVGGATGYTLT
jgi:PKD repeat protein